MTYFWFYPFQPVIDQSVWLPTAFMPKCEFLSIQHNKCSRTNTNKKHFSKPIFDPAPKKMHDTVFCP